MYNGGPIYATLAYQDVKAGTAATGDLAAGGSVMGATSAVDDKDTAITLGGGFKTDVFTVNALVEQTNYKTATTGVEAKRTNYYIGGRFNFTPNDGIRAAYTKRGATSGATNDANQYAIGVDHSMSKTTSVYVTYVKTKDNTTVPTAAADPSALSFGMKHSF